MALKNKMYDKSPRLGRGESGDMEITRKSRTDMEQDAGAAGADSATAVGVGLATAGAAGAEAGAGVSSASIFCSTSFASAARPARPVGTGVSVIGLSCAPLDGEHGIRETRKSVFRLH